MDHRLRGPLKIVRYSDVDLGSIAAALKVDGIDADTVRLYRKCFHQAALWLARMENYRTRVPELSFVERLDDLAKAANRMVRYGCAMLASKPPAGADPSRLVQRKLPRPAPARFRASAAALLKLLPIDEDCPSDQFPDRALAIALAIRGAKSDRALNRIAKAIAGYELDVKAATIAAALLARRARKGAQKVRWVREHTVGFGHTGDAAFNGWIDDMLSLYEKITGRPVRTWVGNAGSHWEGIADGPPIKFLKAAIAPINLKLRKPPDAQDLSDSSDRPDPGWHLDEDAWRSRIRAAQRARVEKDAAINHWIDGMLSRYEQLTGKPVNASGDRDGIVYIPLIDFLKQAASGPIGKEIWSFDEWCNRTAQRARAQKSEWFGH